MYQVNPEIKGFLIDFTAHITRNVPKARCPKTSPQAPVSSKQSRVLTQLYTLFKD